MCLRRLASVPPQWRTLGCQLTPRYRESEQGVTDKDCDRGNREYLTAALRGIYKGCIARD
jgi:hypothetical protein